MKKKHRLEGALRTGKSYCQKNKRLSLPTRRCRARLGKASIGLDGCVQRRPCQAWCMTPSRSNRRKSALLRHRIRTSSPSDDCSSRALHSEIEVFREPRVRVLFIPGDSLYHFDIRPRHQARQTIFSNAHPMLSYEAGHGKPREHRFASSHPQTWSRVCSPYAARDEKGRIIGPTLDHTLDHTLERTSRSTARNAWCNTIRFVPDIFTRVKLMAHGNPRGW